MTDARIIDGDGHIVEPDATFRDFLPAKYASYAPRIIAYDDHFRIAVNDNMSYRMLANPTPLAIAANATTRSRLLGSPDTPAAPAQTANRTAAPVVAVGASDPGGRILDLDL